MREDDDGLSEADFNRSRLIDAIYDAALDPDAYDRFMDAWGEHLAGLMDTSHDDAAGSAARDLELHAHFERADKLSATLRRSNRVFPTPDSLTRADGAFAIVLRRDGTIAALSPSARARCGPAPTFATLAGLLEPESVARLQRGLKTVPLAGDGVAPLAIVRMTGEAGERALHLTLGRAEIGGGRGDYLLLRAIQLDWSDGLETLLREGFGLTNREAGIIRQMLAGQSLGQMADSEGRSLNTLRTQLKSVLRKTATGSQPELVRLVASLSSLLPPGAGAGEPAPRYGTRHVVTLRDGRKMPVHVHGPPNGHAVVFIHGMLDGISVTERIASALADRGIRLICPARPCFGTSDPMNEKERAPESFAADMEEVLDRLGVEKAIVFGHKAGSVYAYAAASLCPCRYSGVLVVSGGVPIVSRRQFKLMKPRQQLVALTARFAPRLLPWILRNGISQLRTGGERSFMEALYRNAPHDHLVASDPDVFPVIRDGYHFTIAQGPRAFEIDAYHVTRDWSSYVRAAPQPVLVLHGELDPVVDVSTVRAFAGRHANVELRVRRDTGQLMFYEFPEYVQNTIVELVSRSALAA